MSLIVPFLPYIIAACLSLGGWLWADHGWCNGACKSQKSRADKLQTAADAAKQLATDLALLWAKSLDQHEKDTRNELDKQAANFAKLDEDTKHLSTLPSIVISGDALRVFDAATAIANSAAPPEISDRSSQEFSESYFTGKWNEAAAAYGDAVTKLHSCIKTYEDYRNEQIHGPS